MLPLLAGTRLAKASVTRLRERIIKTAAKVSVSVEPEEQNKAYFEHDLFSNHKILFCFSRSMRGKKLNLHFPKQIALYNKPD